MSWKKHFTRYDTDTSSSRAKANRWQSWLPEVYSGQPNRVERYTQYDQMDMDSEINGALDTIAEFGTQEESDTELPFRLKYNTDATEAEVQALDTSLKQWCQINDLHRRTFGIMRACIKYGDQFFLRDPETFKLYWVNPEDVSSAIVNESAGKEIDQYIMRNVALNLQDMTTVDTRKLQNTTANGTAGYTTPAKGNAGVYHGGYQQNMTEYAVDSKHVVHLALSDGMNVNWPFGNSILESVFKVYKQKELLEDSIIIYRVQRAPERRVFYIDVGNMPSHKAMAFVERVKNEVHQTRIPNKTGGGTNVMDAAYNPLSIMEDYFFAQTAEGRGSKVDVLQGGDNLGEIDDLKYFTNKLFRGLRIPSSYLPTGADDSAAQYNDGRVGTAYIQELRFNKYCTRLQNLVAYIFDREFKMYMNAKGVNIDNNLFDLRMNPPQNFASYRQSEMDNARVNTFASLQEVPYMSKRFALKRFLGLSQEELAENESMWREENSGEAMNNIGSGTEMRSAGVTPSGIQGDLDTLGDTEPGADAPEPPAEQPTDAGGETPTT